MSKRKQAIEEQANKRESLPQLMDFEFGLEEDTVGPVILLLEEGSALKDEIKAKQERLDEIKDKLTMFQESEELKGLRHNNLTFIARLNNGRVTVDAKKFHEGLLERGVKVETIMDATEAAKKTGASYWVREFSEA